MSIGYVDSDEGKSSDNGIEIVKTGVTAHADESRVLRLRRTKSVTRAEQITEGERKARELQPDRPIHSPRDSLFSWSSGFDKYEGFVNWGGLILMLGGLRLFLENVIKYGVRINPLSWLGWLASEQVNDSYFHTPLFLLATNIHILFAFFLEHLLARDVIPNNLGAYIHATHLTTILSIPIVILGLWTDLFSLLGRTIICAVYTVLFLKLWSYAQVNHWCRSERTWKKKFSRRRSFSFQKMLRKEYAEKINEQEEEAAALNLQQYPENLTLGDLYYFLVAPTLCYELNFPRSQRIRKRFLLRRILEVAAISNILLAMFQQWIIPSVRNSFQAFSDLDFIRCAERLLKLAIPNHILWLCWFYLTFHSFLNTLGELLRFADRNFYQDWWNAKDVGTFWRLWNLPVHKWAVRHIFVPMVKNKYKKSTASIVVFVLSAVLHEYLVSIPLHMYKIGVFLGMMVQVPLVYISTWVESRFGQRWGNMIVWASLILGQPLGIMVYYHDYVVKTFEPSMLEI
ncbi:diacylglycerol O-acyltransferase 1-like isoform X1 [Penaeus chinensis]|uniref:diacylglycerol O-acyltransferase 1-like isoform X1 n=1 Tax=Penaeus chinensis TaxID=139456 RepID=UPI001FB7406B|nr:diacylglycerol O-acyltransferase 1-like isoform X1 [Penaeus chinensis]